MFSLSSISLSKPITLIVPTSRPRIAQDQTDATKLAATATTQRTLTRLDCCYLVNPVTRTIHAQIATLPKPLLLYGRDEFQAACADTPDEHSERVMQILGTDPASSLQDLCSGADLPPPPRVPRELPNWRVKRILDRRGLLETVVKLFDQLPEPRRGDVLAAWNADGRVCRASPTVAAMAASLGLSAFEVDSMFIAAEALEI